MSGDILIGHSAMGSVAKYVQESIKDNSDLRIVAVPGHNGGACVHAKRGKQKMQIIQIKVSCGNSGHNLIGGLFWNHPTQQCVCVS